MRLAVALAVLSVVSCATLDVTPNECRTLGVNVSDSDSMTGIILEEALMDERSVRAACQSPFQVKYGCTIAVNEGEYVIIGVDNFAIRHERCHALFEEWEHC